MTNPITPAVEGHAALVHNRVALYDGAIDVYIADVHVIHAHYRSVVLEITPMPPPADKADAHISKSIIDTAVIADVASPVPGMKDVEPT